LLYGIALISRGQLDEGLAYADRGVALYEGLTTPAVFWPLVLFTRARGFGIAGRAEEGLDLIDQAIELNGQGVMRAEFVLTKGALLLDVSGQERAEPWFRSALDISTKAGLRMSQLRSAVKLAQLSRASASNLEDIETLERVYQSFTEGFNEPDLVEAHEVLKRARGR
jgi:hypothetical protein